MFGCHQTSGVRKRRKNQQQQQQKLLFLFTTRTPYLYIYLIYLNPVIINLITMADRSFTPVSSQNNSIVNPIDMESVRKARDVVMATTPDSLHSSSPVEIQKGFQQTQQTTMERYLFVPGETTLARSDEEIRPLNIEEMRMLMQEPHSDIWKEMKGLRPTNLTKEMKRAIYPEVKELLNAYWKRHKVHTKEIDLTHISGWNGSPEGAKVWLQLTMDDRNGVLLKQMAKDVRNLLEKCGYPGMHCIIMRDDYSPRTADYTIS